MLDSKKTIGANRMKKEDLEQLEKLQQTIITNAVIEPKSIDYNLKHPTGRITAEPLNGVIEVSFSGWGPRPLYYPCNQVSLGLLKMFKKKSFTKKNIEELRLLGFNVVVQDTIHVPDIFR
jgi:hypothetical protein